MGHFGIHSHLENKLSFYIQYPGIQRKCNQADVSDTTKKASTTAAVCIGALSLASAMGIGRFSLTPIMPLMQQDSSLTLAQGSWLATGNYLGYLAGALICAVLSPRPLSAIRWGLVSVGVFTLTMGLTHSFELWFAFRLGAGIASAFVLVGVSAWAMPILVRCGRAQWSGRIFAGVGVGVAFTGIVSLAAGVGAWGSQTTWIVLGIIAFSPAILLWLPSIPDDRSDAPASPRAFGVPSRSSLIAAGCYSAFGYGYIIPATFLPALARGYIDDPAVFGWVWPVFGTTAAISTLVAARLPGRLSPQQLWRGAQYVLAAGVLAPVLAVNAMTLLIAALCVGGSFMVITMAGIKEALRLGSASAAQAVSLMTAGFGVGQIAGPLMVGYFAESHNAFAWPSLIAVSALILSNVALYTVKDGP
jgi:MFS family permease